MASLIGRTFTYSPRLGEMVTRKVIRLIHRHKEDIYELLDPLTKKHHEAKVKAFNKMFASPSGKVLPKGTRTKIIGKQKNVGQ